MLKNLVLISTFVFLAETSFAQVTCETAATPKNPTQLSCGSERTATFVKSTQKVSRVVLLVSDSARGLEKRVELSKINQPFAKLDAKNIAANAAVKSELKKIQKEWPAAKPRVEVLSYEFDQKDGFYAAADLKNSIPLAKLSRSQPRSMASEGPSVMAGGIRKEK